MYMCNEAPGVEVRLLRRGVLLDVSLKPQTIPLSSPSIHMR